MQTRDFYEHFESCRRCQQRPGRLCPDGDALLKRTCDSLAAAIAPIPRTPADA